jgi:hypothetical protein
MRARILIYGSLLIAAIAILWWRNTEVDRKLDRADAIYQELKHPEWSTRLTRAKGILPNKGNGEYKMLYLVDARRVSIPLPEAIRYYEEESDRLGFRECHVDAFPEAQWKFEDEWRAMGVVIPADGDVVVISQNFTSDSTVRRHEPAEKAGAADGAKPAK